MHMFPTVGPLSALLRHLFELSVKSFINIQHFLCVCPTFTAVVILMGQNILAHCCVNLPVMVNRPTASPGVHLMHHS